MTGALARERPLVLGALGLLIAVSWTALVVFADGLHMAAMPMPGRSGVGVLLGSIVMWALMMVAMMTPSAVPMLLLHARVAERAAPDQARAMSAAFIGAYLVTWLAVSIAAALGQEGLARAGLIDPSLTLVSTNAAGVVLIAAGLYQWSPFKRACLAHCRGPVVFLSRHWRPGVSGAFRSGLAHAAYCLGCCWALMLLLFVGGVMNVVWIAALTLLVAAEKMLPRGAGLARTAGVALAGWGLWLLGGGAPSG